jgi:two-component system chemotaxis response regulator CheY
MKARVLIVDDSACMRERMVAILEADGFEVVAEIDDGHAAVDAFQQHEPDLVTMDLLLPSCSGRDAIRRILALDPDARVLAVSARGQEPLVMEALQAGARDYVVKPFRRDLLVHVIKRILPSA